MHEAKKSESSGITAVGTPLGGHGAIRLPCIMLKNIAFICMSITIMVTIIINTSISIGMSISIMITIIRTSIS